MHFSLISISEEIKSEILSIEFFFRICVLLPPRVPQTHLLQNATLSILCSTRAEQKVRGIC